MANVLRSSKFPLAASILCAAIFAAPAAGAYPPQPGQGDDFFNYYLTGMGLFTPAPSFTQVQSAIPLAHKVCADKANGQTDLQAASDFYSGGGVSKLGIVTGSIAGDQATALQIAQGAILAYCSKYNTGDW